MMSSSLAPASRQGPLEIFNSRAYPIAFMIIKRYRMWTGNQALCELGSPDIAYADLLHL